ncbi:MAG: TetR family transcriptional regulator [Mycobacterium sp.]|nr:TetR family transcriptional regulator [Mycobacterium sp.]
MTHMVNPDEVKRAVLDAARGMYARQGYLDTTIKGVAAAAGVAPDLVRRYYANREELFAAAMRLPSDPGTAIAQLLAPGIDGLAERLVRVTLRMLDEPETRERIAAMVSDGAGAAKAVAPLREFLESVIVDRVAAILGVPDARMRVTLAVSYVVGVVGARYVMRMEPLASATEDELVRLVAPAVQSALMGSTDTATG